MRRGGLKRRMEWSKRLRLTWSSWPSQRKSHPPHLQSISTWSLWRMSTTQCAFVNEASLLLLINLTLCIGKGENELYCNCLKNYFSSTHEKESLGLKDTVYAERLCTRHRTACLTTSRWVTDRFSLHTLFLSLLSQHFPPSTCEVFVHTSHFEFLYEQVVTVFRLLETTSLPSWKSWKRGEKVK